GGYGGSREADELVGSTPPAAEEAPVGALETTPEDDPLVSSSSPCLDRPREGGLRLDAPARNGQRGGELAQQRSRRGLARRQQCCRATEKVDRRGNVVPFAGCEAGGTEIRSRVDRELAKRARVAAGLDPQPVRLLQVVADELVEVLRFA